VHHYYVHEQIDGSVSTARAQDWLIKNLLAEKNNFNGHVGLTAFGRAHVHQLLELDLPIEKSCFVGADGRVIEP
jgi:hypothetical protein